MNDDDQEMQQSVVSKDCGDDNDALAEDKKSLMLEEEDMLAIPKLGEGGHLLGSERRIVRECYGMEVVQKEKAVMKMKMETSNRSKRRMIPQKETSAQKAALLVTQMP